MSDSIPLEKTQLRLGFVPLTDCVPLAVAAEQGLFRRHGLDVTLVRMSAWEAVRGGLASGDLDGAQALASMPLAATLGVGCPPLPMLTGLVLDLGGNAITVSETLYQRLLAVDPEAMAEVPINPRAFKTLSEADRVVGLPPPTLATVSAISPHFYELRYWLAAAGVDPDRAMRLIVIPPPQMVANLRAGRIDGFCVGEPWNQRAVQLGLGRVVATSADIWGGRAEKVLAVTETWAETHPRTHRALIGALLEACRWLDDPGNRLKAAKLVARTAYANAPLEVVLASLTGRFPYARDATPQALPDFNRFHRHAANFPWVSQAAWYLEQMDRWGQVHRPVDLLETARTVFRPDLYREVAAAAGVDYPTVDHKAEGAHAEPWILEQATRPIPMGPDRFCDEQVFEIPTVGPWRVQRAQGSSPERHAPTQPVATHNPF